MTSARSSAGTSATRRTTWIGGGVLVAVPAVLAGLWLLRSSPEDAPPPPAHVVPAGSTYALLVGCTEYPGLQATMDKETYEDKVRLEGPANDAKLLRTTLCDYLGVPDANVRVLAGWPDDPARRPTRANILGHLEHLARTVPSGGRIIFSFAGHGSQQRDQDGGDELDRLDEVLLPADVERWDLGPGVVPRAITDDELRAALARLSEAGRSVWAIYDCCHAGSMSRGGGVRTRSLPPSVLGGPELPVAGPVPAAQAAPASRSGPSSGAIASFYAAQSYQLAPEMTLPRSLLARDREPHGLFTFLLARTLQRFGGGLSLRELSAHVQAAYRALPYTEAAPWADGALDLLVGGDAGEKAPTLIVSSADGALTVDAGELRGLTVGSVLEVFRPGGLGAPASRLGTLRVLATGLLTSGCGPVDGDWPHSGAALPARAPARIVSVAPGDLSLPLAVVREDGTPFPLDAPPDALAVVLSDPVLRARLPLVAPAQAAWILRVSAPDGTRADGAPRLALEPGAGGEGLLGQECDSETLGARLEALVRAASLRRIATSGRVPAPSADLKVELQVERSAGQGPEPLPAGARLQPRDVLTVRVQNLTGRDADVSLLMIDGNQEATWIDDLKDGSSCRIGAIETLPVVLTAGRLSDEALGLEQLLVFVAAREDGQALLDVRSVAPPAEAAAAARAAEAAREALRQAAMQVEGSPPGARGAAAALSVVAGAWTTTWGDLALPPEAEAGAVRLDPVARAPAATADAAPGGGAAVGGAALPGSGAVWERAAVLPGDEETAGVLVLWGLGGAWGAWIDADGSAGLDQRPLATLAREAAAGTLAVRLSLLIEGGGRRSARYLRPKEEPCEALVLEDQTHDPGAEQRWVLLEGTWRRGRAWGPWLSTRILGLEPPALGRVRAALRRLSVLP